jgi:hypothetical protein
MDRLLFTFIVSLLASPTQGYVDLWHLPVAAKNCGKGFICHANSTNTITISYGNHSHLYDFHTYVRSSPRLATLGPLELNMTQAEVDPNNKFLTNFVVMGFKSQNYGGHLRVFCNDVYTKKHLDFKFDIHCSARVTALHKYETIVLEWDVHDCSSSNISHYTLMYTESHGKSFLMEVHVASAQLPKSVDLIYINATTTCGETYPIATWKNNATSEETDDYNDMEHYVQPKISAAGVVNYTIISALLVTLPLSSYYFDTGMCLLCTT